MSERLGLIIKEIEDYIAGSRKYMFSKQYIIVNKKWYNKDTIENSIVS